jgi:glycerate 2-kinase
MTDRRPFLRSIFDAAVAAAHPDVVLASRLRPAPKGRVICLAAGKGAGAMAAAAERHYLDTLGLEPSRLVGIATTRHGHGVPTRRIQVVEAGHPVPDEAGLRAADDTLRLAAEATPDDLLLVLLTGGGSANWIAPVEGVSFAQKQQVNRALLRSGAPIGEMNIVRKHLSRIKGGRLARAGQHAAEIVTLAISDVPHDDPSAIASGPTVPDPTTLVDARAVIARYGLNPSDAVRRALADPANETPKPQDPTFDRSAYRLIARPKEAFRAAEAAIRAQGYDCIFLGDRIEGEAREVAAVQARLAQDIQAQGRCGVIVSGGELTVTIRGKGRGGPNQEYALALAQELGATPGIAAVAGDTDGTDGGCGSPDDPAGAFVDETTLVRARCLGLDPAAFLAENDSTGFFERLGDLLQPGPTFTNVNDFRAIFVGRH